MNYMSYQVDKGIIIPRQRRRDIVLALSVRPSFRPSVRPALLCPEPYLGSALADFIETWYEYNYIYGLEDDARQMALCSIC